MSDIEPDFRSWRIVIYMPYEDAKAIYGTLGALWPNLMVPEAIERGAKTEIREAL